MAKRGRIIAFDGLDGVGKSLQAECLAARLWEKGLEAKVFREPGGTPLGERLREVLLEGGEIAEDPLLEALLFSASRRALTLSGLEPRSVRGAWSLLDRSFLSTLVYQGLVGGVDLALLERITHEVHGKAFPDRILVLDVPAELASRRRKNRGEKGKGETDAFECRGDAYLERVGDAYRSLIQSHAALCVRINASGTVEEVAERCFQAVEDLLPGVGE